MSPVLFVNKLTVGVVSMLVGLYLDMEYWVSFKDHMHISLPASGRHCEGIGLILRPRDKDETMRAFL